MIDTSSGIAASVGWGVADFLGGAASRRIAVLRVLIWSQLLGGVLATSLSLILFGVPQHSWILLGAIGGLCGGIGIIAFYMALSRAPMGIVAPISACSGIVLVTVALIRGESPGTLALVGAGIALLGIVLVAHGEHGVVDESTLHFDRVALICSLLAVFGFGGALAMLDIASGTGGIGQSIWSSVGLRYGSLIVIALAAAVSRTPVPFPPRDTAWALIGVGVCEVAANAAFAIGAAHGNLAVVSMVSSTYPLTTALLARVVFGERLTIDQIRGASCIVVGGILMSIPA